MTHTEEREDIYLQGYDNGLRAALEAVRAYRINPSVKTAEELAIERLIEAEKGARG